MSDQIEVGDLVDDRGYLLVIQKIEDDIIYSLPPLGSGPPYEMCGQRLAETRYTLLIKRFDLLAAGAERCVG